MPEFSSFTYRDAHYRIASDKPEIVTRRIHYLRDQIEHYITTCPEFKTALEPVDNVLPGRVLTGEDPGARIPEIIRRMDAASRQTGVGPMAAVAGTIAQMAVEYSVRCGAREGIIDNGGDIFLGPLSGRFPIYIGIYSASHPAFRELAYKILPTRLPLAVCSSSSTMGHSLSFGNCDLATVFSSDASLADAAATAGCNAVHSIQDIERVLKNILAFTKIEGAVIIKDGHIGMAGNVPEIVRHRDPALAIKVSKSERSNFPG